MTQTHDEVLSPNTWPFSLDLPSLHLSDPNDQGGASGRLLLKERGSQLTRVPNPFTAQFSGVDCDLKLVYFYLLHVEM